MKKLHFTIILLCCFFIQLTYGQETKRIGKFYLEKNNEKWYIVESNAKYLVDEKVLTIKLTESHFLENLLQNYNLKILRKSKSGFVDLELPTGIDVITIAEKLSKERGVELLDINSIGMYNINPNDTHFSSQWYLPKIGMPNVWNIISGQSCISIAIIDSGVEFTHSDLGNGGDGYNSLWSNSGEDAWTNINDPTSGNGIDNDGNGFIDDWRGWNFENNNNDVRGGTHGTMVAGIVGAKANNSSGIAGVGGGYGSQGFRLISIASGAAAPLSAILDDAIDYAVNNGAHVIQMSLTIAYSSAVETAIQNAISSGIPVICASGNNGFSTVSFPASTANVISVGSTSTADTRSSFSNYGTQLFIAAPGENIRTTKTSNSYGDESGTSFAAPQVSAVVGLIRQINPTYPVNQIRNILSSTADKTGGYSYNWDISRPGHSQELGYGRLNAEAAVIAAIGGPISGPNIVCSTSNFTLSGTAAGPVSWSSSNSSILTINSSTGVASRVAFGSGEVTITATINTGCGNVQLTKVVWVGNPELKHININTAPCAGHSQTITTSVAGNPTSLSWNMLSGHGSSAIFFDYGDGSAYFDSYAFLCYDLRLEMYNACGYSEHNVTICVEDCSFAFKVFPNPAKDYINIQFDNFTNKNMLPGKILFYEEETIKVALELDSKQILSKVNNEGILRIDVSNLNRGIYYIHLIPNSENGNKIDKVRILLE